MQTLLLYIAILNIVLTLCTLFFVWKTARFPETPTRPYLFLTGAFFLRAYAQVTGVGIIDEVLKIDIPSTHLIISSIVSLTVTIFFGFAYIEKYVLLKKKYNQT